ncbi:putative adhesin [Streptomyces griseofuscus]|uniref:putative adhesin n=1 Tax=Streptomyces griseofuscus TaxID=146922 RepID=UPI0036ABAD72
MGYVLIGHAALFTDYRAPTMEIVAVPGGTTLQFYADAGQGLAYGPEHLDQWDQLHSPWPPLTCGHVTYNYTLRPPTPGLLGNDPQLGGHTLVAPGVGGMPEEMRMCTGTRNSCPTDPRWTEAGAVHRCDGVLGMFQGDLHWLACGGFVGADPIAANAVNVGLSKSVVLGSDPDWVPVEADQWSVAAVNLSNVKHAEDGDALRFVLGGFMLLIGEGHDTQYATYVEAAGRDRFRGEVRVCKGNWHHPGTLEFWGVPPQKEALVERAVALFSEKRVFFLPAGG